MKEPGLACTLLRKTLEEDRSLVDLAQDDAAFEPIRRSKAFRDLMAEFLARREEGT
jgi:hypothetical protein